MRQKTNLLLVVMIVMLVWVFQAGAEEKPASNMQFLVEKLQADKRLMVAENMQLTEAEASGFWPVFEQYQHELFLLRARTLRLIDDYAKAYNNSTMTEEKARTLLDEMLAIESLGLTLRQVYLPEFRSVLPDVKVVRYYQIENKINAALMYQLASDIPLIKTSNQ